MTLPNERYRAINQAREFLRKLIDPSKTKRVPRVIREEAYWVLRHFPGEHDLFKISHQAPTLLEAPIPNIKGSVLGKTEGKK
jgi:hypothetical protein